MDQKPEKVIMIADDPGDPGVDFGRISMIPHGDYDSRDIVAGLKRRQAQHVLAPPVAGGTTLQGFLL